MKPLILVILDGWGYREDSKNNAIAQADTPIWNDLWAKNPHSLLDASGENVGLPNGQMGNSEVGHMNIGAGRKILQNLPRINQVFADNEMPKKLADFVTILQKTGGKCHLFGLFSDGGVHSHINHIRQIATIISAKNIEVCVHAVLDGRDAPPRSGLEFLSNWQEEFINNSLVNIATISGRYWAMDRDNRWSRIEKYYNAMVNLSGGNTQNPQKYISEQYNNNITDEFVIPCIIDNFKGINNEDGFISCNFRADRSREIMQALMLDNFTSFNRINKPKFSAKLMMTQYSVELADAVNTLFPNNNPKNTFGEIIENQGLAQLRIAETEKYAHVTFFFSGGREKEFKGEKRILIPSPNVATYDLQPEMSAEAVTDNILKNIDNFDIIIVNYANGDMVGHTGKMNAAIKAIESLDFCLERLIKIVEEKGATMLITADHGNAELMKDTKTGEPHTAHTMEKVPFIVYGVDNINLKNGSLADIAPTILELLKIEKPAEMSGKSLII